MKKMPSGNQEAGLPNPEKIVGNYVTSVSVKGGAITITLGNRVNANVPGKTVTMRPAIVNGTGCPNSPGLCLRLCPRQDDSNWAQFQCRVAASPPCFLEILRRCRG